MNTNENNKEELPKPLSESGWSKTWRKEDLDRPEKDESKVWIESIRKPIEEAVIKWSEDHELAFWINFEYGKKDWSGWIKRDMDEVFKRFHAPDAGDMRECQSLAEEISSIVWSEFENEDASFDFFRLRVFAVPDNEFSEALADYAWHFDD
jgi:hypothetical protein